MFKKYVPEMDPQSEVPSTGIINQLGLGKSTISYYLVNHNSRYEKYCVQVVKICC